MRMYLNINSIKTSSVFVGEYIIGLDSDETGTFVAMCLDLREGGEETIVLFN